MNHRPGIAIVLPSGFEQLKDWQPGQTNKPAIQLLHHPTTGAERQWASAVDACEDRPAVRRSGRDAVGLVDLTRGVR